MALKNHICPNCRMWGYIQTHNAEGYFCFEKLKWIMKEPLKSTEPRKYIPQFREMSCRNFRKRKDL